MQQDWTRLCSASPQPERVCLVLGKPPTDQVHSYDDHDHDYDDDDGGDAHDNDDGNCDYITSFFNQLF